MHFEVQKKYLRIARIIYFIFYLFFDCVRADDIQSLVGVKAYIFTLNCHKVH
jgi:hypothetical protein